MAGLDPLIQRAQEGDERAFHEIFLKHRGDVARIIHRFIGPSSDIEDIVQDVFIHVFRSIAKFRGESKFSTWLYRLTVNVTRMHLRRARSRPRIADVDVPESPPDRPPAMQPDAVHERSQRVTALYALLHQLSDKKRTVLVLHDFEGTPAKDIAELLEVPVLTVRTRLFYARKELYAALAADPRLGPAVEHLMQSLPGRPRARQPAAQPVAQVGELSERAGGREAE